MRGKGYSLDCMGFFDDCVRWCCFFFLPQMPLSWCGSRSCMHGFSAWRNISSTRPWCSTPSRQRLELWARTIKSWISSKDPLILFLNYLIHKFKCSTAPQGNGLLAVCIDTVEYRIYKPTQPPPGVFPSAGWTRNSRFLFSFCKL